MIEQLSLGTTVYVALGYMTTQAGRISGCRLTTLGSKSNTDIEYFVTWFGKRVGQEESEWFDSRFVHTDPAESFAPPKINKRT